MSYCINDGITYWGGKSLSYPLPHTLSKAIDEMRKQLEEDLTKNENNMEEKKKNKMTKAEAFEWLKGKKVYVNGHSAHIQATLFEAGFKWGFSGTDISNIEKPFLYFAENGHITYGDDMQFYVKSSEEEVSAEDIFSLEIEDECAKDDEDPYFGGRIKDLQEMLEDDEVLIITKTNFLTMTK